MSKLSSLQRPYVEFDPENSVHREYFIRFLDTGSWADCPVKFATQDEQGFLIGAIQRKLILWYATQEQRGHLTVRPNSRGRVTVGITPTGIEMGVGAAA